MAIPEDLFEHLQSGCVLVGVGNILCGDDGFGPAVIQRFKDAAPLPVIDAGIAPENYFGPLRKLRPKEVIIFDAVRLDGPAGSVHWLGTDELGTTGISTHGPSLDLFIQFIEQELGAAVHMVGMVPERVGMGETMSQPVKEAVEQLANQIIDKFR